ncbi:MAG: tetratricopeptide repeat protein [bacterium]|nr:tetratricopeptide repeat protein [bacterium]
MLPMYSLIITLRGICLLVVVVPALMMCGCRKPAAAPTQPKEQADKAASHSQPDAKSRHGWFIDRGQPLVRRAVKELSDPDRWQRIFVAVLRAAGEACERDLSDPRTHIRCGDKALACGQTDLAIDCFTRAITLAPKNADAHRALAVTLVASAVNQSSTSEAEELYRRATKVYRAILDINADDETARFNLALALMRSGSASEADEVLRPLLNSDKFATEATFNLAVVLSAQGKLKQAAVLLKRLIRTNRTMGSADLAVAHTHLGEVLADLGDTAGALKAYTEAASLSPNDLVAWLNLAVAARGHGSYGYAVTATRKAVALSPLNSEIHLRLGNLLLELHRATGEERFLREAVDAWRQSVKIDPSQTSLRQRVRIYERQASETQPAGPATNK